MPRHQVFGAAAILAAMMLTSCASSRTKHHAEEVAAEPESFFRPTGDVQKGKASWYSIRTNGGTRTASGERLRNDAPTAAHRHLPMGTMVKVTNLHNGASEVVRITDRGPFIRGRIIDVTIGTAERLGMVKAGVVPVEVETVELDYH